MNSSLHCPGQDLRTWKPEDIFEVPCPHCGNLTEIWKDEPIRTCSKCRQSVPNPRMNRGCAQWCSHSQECGLAPSAGQGALVRDVNADGKTPGN